MNGPPVLKFCLPQMYQVMNLAPANRNLLFMLLIIIYLEQKNLQIMVSCAKDFRILIGLTTLLNTLLCCTLHNLTKSIVFPLLAFGFYSLYSFCTFSNMITSYNFNRFCTLVLSFRLCLSFCLMLLPYSINLSLSIPSRFLSFALVLSCSLK